MRTSRRFRRVFALLLSVSLLTIAAGTASAAPARPRVTIDDQGVTGTTFQADLVVNRAAKQIASCNYVVDAGTAVSCGTKVPAGKATRYLVSIAGQAVGGHAVTFTVVLTDGGRGSVSTSFTIIAPPARVFAIAYTDVDGAAGFGATDRLIARLVDTNRSNVIDAGDTVETGSFPSDLAGALPRIDLGVTSHVVTGVVTTADYVTAVASGANQFTWVDSAPGAIFDERVASTGLARFEDLHDACGDFIRLIGVSPSVPAQTIVALEDSGTCDDAPFLEVDLDLPV